MEQTRIIIKLFTTLCTCTFEYFGNLRLSPPNQTFTLFIMPMTSLVANRSNLSQGQIHECWTSRNYFYTHQKFIRSYNGPEGRNLQIFCNTSHNKSQSLPVIQIVLINLQTLSLSRLINEVQRSNFLFNTFSAEGAFWRNHVLIRTTFLALQKLLTNVVNESEIKPLLCLLSIFSFENNVLLIRFYTIVSELKKKAKLLYPQKRYIGGTFFSSKICHIMLKV